MAVRIGRIPFPVALGVVAALTVGLFLVGYRLDGEWGGALLLLVPIAFAGTYLWDAARSDREAALAAVSATPPPTPSATGGVVAGNAPDPAEEPFEDPVEEADRLDRATRGTAAEPADE